MEVIEQLQTQSQFFKWSEKIALKNTEEKGISVICTEPLLPNELIIHIPSSLLVNIKTITHPPEFDELTPHEALALEIIQRRKKQDDLWAQSLPVSFDSLPVSWKESDQIELLPRRYRERIYEQKREIEVLASKCNLAFEDAEWGWKVVNTRCLYWEHGGMTLAPALDYLNHVCDPSGKTSLQVRPSSQGITVVTQSHYNSGDELTFCYGPHENGFLLVEYGFMVPENPWNFVDISEQVSLLVLDQKKWLEEHNYWDDWTLDSEGEPSFRVEVAFASKIAQNPRLMTAIVSGFDDGSRYIESTRKLIKSLALTLEEKLKQLIQVHHSLRKELYTFFVEYINVLSKI